SAAGNRCAHAVRRGAAAQPGQGRRLPRGEIAGRAQGPQGKARLGRAELPEGFRAGESGLARTIGLELIAAGRRSWNRRPILARAYRVAVGAESAATPALAHCASCSERSPDTPMAPTSFPSTSSGRPPSTGMAPSRRNTRRPAPPFSTLSWKALVGRL